MPDDPYYLIRKSHIPEVIRKTVEVTELLQRQPSLNVAQAAKQVGISRSAYYKYKDVVRPFYSAVQGQIVTLALTLQHTPGVLSEVLNTLAVFHANILTINQSLPLQGVATVIVSLDTHEIEHSFDTVWTALRNVSGVEQVNLVGQG
ncbi:ACT domain-containing protein [Alicyclobacillaceae bacterium I2511]|nr:ACT domain-containing protein [Alicyclobacillaceae bacterium I2511]